ncbi:MAG: hypothetical protein QNK23_10420 [Crocinitomicaceae bacterium]|nr:hypothetical protein [Crocinitomicaceae bacterium]
MIKNPLKPILFAVLCGTLLCSCDGDGSDNQDNIDDEVLDPNSSLNTVFDGKIFSIPSPVQTAYLIKSLDLEFDGTLLNDEKNVGNYVTEYKQALNLGIYGTDLGYSTLYEQKDITMRYLGSVEKLTSELGLDAAFDTSFLQSFEENNNDEESMIRLMSDAFRQADNFLKHANRKPTSALILTGGWIESIYFACRLNEEKPSPDIERRIGEQKQSLNSIIDILVEYNKEGSNDELIEQMRDLKLSFDKVIMTYEYAAPDTDKENKITTFHHSLDIAIDEVILQEIREKIEIIRSNIIN